MLDGDLTPGMDWPKKKNNSDCCCCLGSMLAIFKYPKIIRQVSKTSVSLETSSKKHTSSLQNERFVRDFLQKSHVKSQNKRYVRDFLKNSHVKVHKTNVSYETSSKSPTETPIGAHTSRSPAKQSHDSSPSKRHRFTRQSQCNNDIHLYHNSQPPDSLRLPRIFQSTVPITKYYLHKKG